MTEALITVENLTKRFPIRRGLGFKRSAGQLTAVAGIDFTIRRGETLALVGESGCGKTTTGRLLLRLDTPTEGRVLLDGEDIQDLTGEALKDYRSRVQAVFQDPWESLSPRMRVKDIVAEALVAKGGMSREQVRARVAEVLVQVGLSTDMIRSYPHEFSGGQRQRIAVAAALASYPELIVLDEPVSALDVSIRAQVMNLLKDLQSQFGVAYLLVAHDLATVRFMAHQTAVMYLGRLVEYADTEEEFQHPLHPYTQALFAASLPSHPDLVHEEIVLAGEVPSPLDPPPGCTFHPRCPYALPRCSVEIPVLREVGPGQSVACHLYEEASSAAPSVDTGGTGGANASRDRLDLGGPGGSASADGMAG